MEVLGSSSAFADGRDLPLITDYEWLLSGRHFSKCKFGCVDKADVIWSALMSLFRRFVFKNKNTGNNKHK